MALAGLLLESMDKVVTLPRLRAMLRVGGTLVNGAQSASAAMPGITPSPSSSLNALPSNMRLVQPDRLQAVAEAHGF
jgi:hypothetical protein